jgi:uncharacterized protein
MKWNEMRQSQNVEDVRGSSPRMGRRSVGLGGIIIALLASLLFGVNPQTVLNGLQGADVPQQPQVQQVQRDDRDAQFVRAVLGDTEDVWKTVFRKQIGEAYQPPNLVLFSGAVNSACGFAEAAAGPFYCPRDQKVYLDMQFFRQIEAAASGPNADFARAYAIAHEIGHHIQHQLGITTQVQQRQARSDEATSNALSTRLELQADCFAGVWANTTAQRDLIGNQDIEAALNAAAQIGDDYLQYRAKGYVVPESFTHGSSQERVNWFSRGVKTGDVNQCDTFSR